MGYRTNSLASSLRLQRSNTIGVIVQLLNSYFIANALSGIEKVANEAGFNIIISQSLESVKKEIANTQTMFKSRVDGLIVSLSWDTESLEHFDKFFKKEIPVIFFDRSMEGGGYKSVVIDNFKYSYQITRHMIEQGCRKIMHIGGSQKRNVYTERFNGYKHAMREAGLKVTNEMVLINNLTDQGGIDAANYVLGLKNKPDGIFAASDICAASCMSVLKEAGISIPADIAIAGFNNDPITRMTDPKITTVVNPGYTMGETVATALINHLNSKEPLYTTDKIVVDSEIIIRNSTVRRKK